MNFLWALARPVLFQLDPEKAHGLTIAALRTLPLPAAAKDDLRLKVEAFGLSFPNPIGMAAGFDKGGDVPDALLRAGFGFTEAGTITPRPQPGNPRPRLFRLTEDEGVINRFGFNSEGHEAVHRRLTARAGRPGIVGINVGANKDASDRVEDYVTGINAFADVASYFTVNISSPNTPGLRDLQQAGVLDDLLARVLDARDRNAQRFGRRPVLLKIAPDLTEGDLDDIVRVARARAVDGMIIGNTTITRPLTLASAQKSEAGGLSGRPLFELSTKVQAQVFLRVEGAFPVVGAGGITDATSAFAKIEAGATLLQVYSSLVYAGLPLVEEIKRGILDRLAAERLTSLAAVVGRKATEWSTKAL
ncbi:MULTISPECIES: quinone-dependent dihydroorotate dehydrogenase [unclassified Beijerinckia]|uniref:quinone-dependent dihydroorotate dehydrogenase n=1 Tax=unclassified Beijerinckia TaxID=2638183 RepID=UPI00089A9B74|nr:MULTISPECIES: quinone-dependent dihydroorotate dehydrogenase [unclassified Beijerinckia]SEC54488.1 dihydroorotate oxidase A [Beijerinckia sp. 28-YEA-48]